MKLYDTDYVIVDSETLEPIESLNIIYAEDMLQEELRNNPLSMHERAIPLTKLHKELQERYLKHIEKVRSNVSCNNKIN